MSLNSVRHSSNPRKGVVGYSQLVRSTGDNMDLKLASEGVRVGGSLVGPNP